MARDNSPVADSTHPKANIPTAGPVSTRQETAQGEAATIERLNTQITWYDRRSTRNRALYKCVKTVIIAAAAAIPVLTTAGLPHGPMIAAALGVSIAVLEGVQQLNQYQANWASFRTTAEALKHEKYFYLAKAGPYLAADNAHALLAERIEALVAQELSKWFMSQSQNCISDPLRTTNR